MGELKESNMNYTAQVFAQASANRPALIFQSEVFDEAFEISWEELEAQVVSIADYLGFVGVKKGDVIAGYMTNIPETIIAYLATVAIGAVWMNVDPKSKASDTISKLASAEPKVLIAVDGFHWQKEKHNRIEAIAKIAEKVSSIEKVVLFPYCIPDCDRSLVNKSIFWNETYNGAAQAISYAPITATDDMLLHTNDDNPSQAYTHKNLISEPLAEFALDYEIKDGTKILLYANADSPAWFKGVNALHHGATLCLYDGFADETYIASIKSNMAVEHSIVQYTELAKDGFWGKLKGWF